MHRTTALLASAALLAGGATLTAETATAAEAPSLHAKNYRNCDALQRDWKNGVARGPKAARKQVRDGNSRPATNERARAVYRENRGDLDRDKDGTACEN